MVLNEFEKMNILKTLLAYIMVVLLLSGCGGDAVPEKLLPPALPSVGATVDGRTIVLTAEFKATTTSTALPNMVSISARTRRIWTA